MIVTAINIIAPVGNNIYFEQGAEAPLEILDIDGENPSYYSLVPLDPVVKFQTKHCEDKTLSPLLQNLNIVSPYVSTPLTYQTRNRITPNLLDDLAFPVIELSIFSRFMRGAFLEFSITNVERNPNSGLDRNPNSGYLLEGVFVFPHHMDFFDKKCVIEIKPLPVRW